MAREMEKRSSMANSVYRARTAVIALVFVAQSASAAYYSLTGGGVQFQIGDGLLLPIQPTTISGSPAGTMTMFPPLLVPPNPNPAKALVQQTAGADPKKMTVAPGAKADIGYETSPWCATIDWPLPP